MSENTVLVTLSYLKRLDIFEKEKPFHIFFELPHEALDQRRTNLQFEEKEHPIQDIRDNIASFSLDKQGFMIRDWPTSLSIEEFSDRSTVEAKYYPEIDALIRSEFEDVVHYYIFDWRLRASNDSGGAEMVDMNDWTQWLRPVSQVHVDQTPSAALHRVEMHLQERMDELLQYRFRIINVWRSLNGKVEDYPLALCDGRTMADKDLYECDQIRKHFIGASYWACFRDTQKWYYLRDQQPNEVSVLKMFDSKEGVAKFCPHSSFKNPACGPSPMQRKSIELRFMLFTKS